MIIDFFLIGILVSLRADRISGIRLVINDPFTLFLWPGAFILQNLMVFWGFWSLYRKEEHYELYPINQSEQIKYHYFDSQQLLVFINLVTRAVTGKSESYSKIYVTKEPKPNLFSFQILGKRVIILNPTILQIAETQELRASLAIDASITGHSSFIRIYAQQMGKFYFLPFIIPFIPIIRETIIILGEPREYSLNTLVILLFTVIGLFVVMSSIRWLHTILLKTSNRNLILHADYKAAKLVGARAVINTLLKLGQRQEAIEILLDEVRFLEELERGRIWEGSFEESKLLKLVQRFPISQINRDVALELAPEIFLRERFGTLRSVYLCNIIDEEEIIKEAKKRLKKKRAEFIEEWKNKENDEQIPESVDLALRLESSIRIEEELGINPESVINETEIEKLVNEILKKPRRPLFVHELAKTTLWSLEPPICDRIINIWQNLSSFP
jgi:hypothetical protein